MKFTEEKTNLLRFMETLIGKMLIQFPVVDIAIIEMITEKMQVITYQVLL